MAYATKTELWYMLQKCYIVQYMLLGLWYNICCENSCMLHTTRIMVYGQCCEDYDMVYARKIVVWCVLLGLLYGKYCRIVARYVLQGIFMVFTSMTTRYGICCKDYDIV
jgi:hypothetical protein